MAASAESSVHLLTRRLVAPSHSPRASAVSSSNALTDALSSEVPLTAPRTACNGPTRCSVTPSDMLRHLQQGHPTLLRRCRSSSNLSSRSMAWRALRTDKCALIARQIGRTPGRHASVEIRREPWHGCQVSRYILQPPLSSAHFELWSGVKVRRVSRCTVERQRY
jgi:hypothetical protein